MRSSVISSHSTFIPSPQPHRPESVRANAAMVKNQKSSASSATRKKHAKKAATAAGEVVENPLVPKQKKPRGKEKARLKAEPKKRVYIPPVRPHAIQPDPLETLGIAYSISSELLVVLRKLGKKDLVTKIRALEELQSDWILKAKETNNLQLFQEIATVLPVWVSLPIKFPRLRSDQTIASSRSWFVPASFPENQTSIRRTARTISVPTGDQDPTIYLDSRS